MAVVRKINAAEPPRKRAKTQTAKKGRAKEGEKENLHPVIVSTISEISIEAGIDKHYDIPGHYCVLTHNNIIVHSVRHKYDNDVHIRVLECNKYENPLKCLRTGKMEGKIVERSKYFVYQMATQRNNRLEIMTKWRGDFRVHRAIDLNDRDAARKYKHALRSALNLACDALDKGDEYMDSIY
ncbi:hypothetical protein H4219_001723 [Mycoemilia scoparia]|uniref:Uncharacterized protein n=1 Tax=Mycoemilia scoparia TaxID=417184 RepID=A0A9W8DRH7_9FUNG|nr:hypothetical protein H4219_001723 [Mycoemilia scoparia]